MKNKTTKFIVMGLALSAVIGCGKSSDSQTVPETNTSSGAVGPFDMQVSDASTEKINKFSVAVDQAAGKVEFNYTPTTNSRLQFQGATTAVTGCDASQVKVTHLWFTGPSSGGTLTKILQRNDYVDATANTKYTLVVAYENIKGCSNVAYEMRIKKTDAVPAPTPAPVPVPAPTTQACAKLAGRFAVNMTSIEIRQTRCSLVTFYYDIYDSSGAGGQSWTQGFFTDGIERIRVLNDGNKSENAYVKAYYATSGNAVGRLELETRSMATPNSTLRKEYYLEYPSQGMVCLTVDSYLNGVAQKKKDHVACGNGYP